jgi:hypothetical protein
MVSLALIALIVLVYVAYQNWQRAIKLTLVLVILEGALRKWALPQASQLIYFLKDFVLFGAYLRYFSLPVVNRKLIVNQQLITSLLGLAFMCCALQALNPGLGSPIIGLVGMKNYFFYVPLIWMLAKLFQTKEELFTFLRRYLLLLLPVGLLAIAQFFSPVDSPLNVYAWGEDGPDVAVGGNSQSVRVTGTFSYIAGYSVYLGVCFSLLLPILSLKQTRFWQWVTTAELMLVAITGFMSGARGLILTYVLMLLGYFGLQGITSFSTFFQTLKKFIVPGVLGFFIVSQWFQSAFNSFWLRFQGNTDMESRVSTGFLEPFANFQHKGLDGYGTGSTFQANGVIRALLDLPPGEHIPVYFEGEMGRVALEIGPLGFLLWYGLRICLLLALWKTYDSLKNPVFRQLALSIFLYQGLSFTSQIVFNHAANLYYWFLNGFIFLLPQLEYNASQKDDSTP